MSISKGLKQFYISRFISMFYFWIAISISYLAFRGFTTVEAFALMSTYSILTLIFEFPTGVISDYFGHKVSLMMGQLVYTVILIFMSMQLSHYGYYIVIAFTALGTSLISGSDTAMLKSLSNDFRKDYGNYLTITTLAVIIASFLSGFIAKFSMSATIWITSITAFIGFLTLINIEVPKNNNGSGNIFKLAKKSLTVIKNNNWLLLLLISVGFLGGYLASTKILFSSLAEISYLNIELVGIIVGVFFIIRAVAAQVSKKLGSTKDWEVLLMAVIPLLFGVIFYNWWYIPIIALIMSGFFLDLFSIRSIIKINEMISDEILELLLCH